MGYGCGYVGGGLIFFFLAMGCGCHIEVVVGEVAVEVVVAGWKVFVVDIFYFILMSSLCYFNQSGKNINPLILDVL